MSRKQAHAGDYQERAQQFSVGDNVVPVGLDPAYAGRVIAVWPAIGAVDVEFPELTKRMVVEELLHINGSWAITPTPSATTETVPVSLGPLNTRKRRQAVYWASRDRQYRATREEQEAGCYNCPKCKETALVKTIYKRRDGQSDRLLGCPSCLWLVREGDLLGAPQINRPRCEEELRMAYQRWERDPGRALRAEIAECQKKRPEVFRKLVASARGGRQAASSRVFRVMDKILRHMRAEDLLNELVRAMSDREAMENFQYIARMENVTINGRRRFDMLDSALAFFDDDYLLQSLVKAMSDKEAMENFEYIAQNWDIDI